MKQRKLGETMVAANPKFWQEETECHRPPWENYCSECSTSLWCTTTATYAIAVVFLRLLAMVGCVSLYTHFPQLVCLTLHIIISSLLHPDIL